MNNFICQKLNLVYNNTNTIIINNTKIIVDFNLNKIIKNIEMVYILFFQRN